MLRCSKRLTGRIASLLTLLSLSVPAVYAGTWQVTVTSTNSDTSAPLGSIVAVSMSQRTGCVATASAGGVSSTALSGSTTASYSGTWTFRWVPSSSTDWPSAYTISQTSIRTFSAIVNGATGTAQVDTCLATLAGPPPTQGTGDLLTTVTTNTSTPNLTITTTNMVLNQYDHAVSNGWVSERRTTVSTKSAYSAAYFPANFTAPANIVLTFNVSATGTPSISGYTSANTGGGIAATFTAVDVFSGQ
jgi:hypothetical protein